MTGLRVALVIVWGFVWLRPSRAEAPKGEGTVPLPTPEGNTVLPPAEATISATDAVAAANKILDQVSAKDDPQGALRAAEQLDELISRLRRAQPESPWLLYLVGRAMALRGRANEGAEHLRRFVETPEGRNDWRVHWALGNMLSETFPRLALANFRKALAMKSDEPRVLSALSRCELTLGYKDDALKHAREAVAADGGTSAVFVARLATACQQLGLLEEARQHATEAIRIGEVTMKTAPVMYADVIKLKNQIHLLISILDGRLAQDPKNAEAYIEIAENKLRLAKIELVITRLETAGMLERALAEFEMPPPELLERLAILRAELGQQDSAAALFERLLQVQPDNPVAAQWLEKLRADRTSTDTP